MKLLLANILRLGVYFFIVFFSAKLLANPYIDSALLEYQSLWAKQRIAKFINPAEHSKYYFYTQSDISIGFCGKKHLEIKEKQEGKARSEGGVMAKSVVFLDENTSLWGSASYSYEYKEKVRWSSTSDYKLLSPYILADSVGGDTSSERYLCSGGGAHRWKHWSVGGEVKFRAEQEYRAIDPRMRGIVADLTMTLGTSYRLQTGYDVGLLGSSNIYRQINDVKLYNEAGGATEYLMKGLGAYNARFLGQIDGIYYRGGGYSVGLNISPSNRSGFYTNLNMSKHRYLSLANDLMNLPLNTLYLEKLDGSLAWEQDKSYKLTLWGRANLSRRVGNEEIIGDVESGVYPILARLTMYRSSDVNLYGGVVYGRGRLNPWYVQMGVGYLSHNSFYVYPERYQSYQHFYTELRGQIISVLKPQLNLVADVGVRYFSVLSHRLDLPYADTPYTILQMLEHNHRYYKTPRLELQVSIRADYRLPTLPYSLYFALSVQKEFSSLYRSGIACSSTLGVRF